MTYNFDCHEAIPASISSYLLTVSDADNIAQIPLEDINGFLNGLEDYADYMEASRNW